MEVLQNYEFLFLCRFFIISIFFHIRMTEGRESFVVKERGRPAGAASLVQFCIQFRYVQSCQNVYFTKSLTSVNTFYIIYLQSRKEALT